MASSAEEPKKQTARSDSVLAFFQIACAFAIVFCPLVILATLLCLFVTTPTWTIQHPLEENANLPIEALENSVFYTAVFMGKVSMTSSFAPNVAQFAVVPFLLLCSYLVALELANQHRDIGRDEARLLRGDQKALLDWISRRFCGARRTERADGTRIAGIGALIAFLLTVLVLIGDKLLQGTMDTTLQRVYGDNFRYIDAQDHYDYNGGFSINGAICGLAETSPNIYYNSTAPNYPPCSIDNTTSPWTLWEPTATYRLLATGLLNQTSDYNKEDFDALWNATYLGTFNHTQLITHIDQATHDQHVFFFNPMLAQGNREIQKRDSFSLVDSDLDRYGLDYVANTTSIITKCFPTTRDCAMDTINSSDLTIAYHCSDMFSGDMSEIPTNGLERLKGWNTSFYELDNGVPRQISIASQLNPFHYNVTAVVDSINIGGLIRSKDPQVAQGTIVRIGDGRVAFSISCNSTVYDVTYSLVDGNIHAFNATPADPSIAAIIKAPLQAGFGSYSLFERAALSTLTNNLTVMDLMELAFSQTSLSLAAGVYTRIPNLEQRWRADMTMTQIRKGPFYFLVICMFFYAFVVLVFTVAALSIFRRSDVQEVQARLIMED
ncbi:hypothetical protein HBI56_226400 [Parastagonospora nodorum]|uniref:Uncharacterized protein n=1 Tax=Phaeosphaeria nodorum (strain SN15 / ATCC MYA-4574 / FGSC 10173) TaxID=321614 RepID=A0A7U2EZC2_PHANO|nr:hypothetical protein HBH56_227390 [Parastagonospora nodorum]QRC95747.1 hypothetical protein JI435_158970 [Parastagonospora nodorum SN15]KAH3921673.1 hypothetical protein HBH54_235410 [Parastagonospora nodorum]KAH3939494.1 hypothetical protein HBH53_233250 [Parastagonospora nodorum]KAH3958989.1 hypothetical protein HBH51_203200 [Parastagonospora nodorum]